MPDVMSNNNPDNANSPLVPHCELCGAVLPWENVINPSYQLYPCPNCRRRVDYTTGKVVPLIDFLAAGRCYGACGDARGWTAADCLHLMTMVSEPRDGLRADVLLALNRSPYYRALITFATLHAHRELRDVDMGSAISDGDGETLGTLYGLLREAALHLYHRTRNSTFVSFVGWLATETGVPVTELAGQLPELMTDEEVRAPKELREVGEMTVRGKRICITGDLDAPREDYAARIQEAGGRCVTAVSRRTDYLVVGPNHGLSKIAKARQYGVKVVQPEALYAALAHPEPPDDEEIVYYYEES